MSSSSAEYPFALVYDRLDVQCSLPVSVSAECQLDHPSAAQFATLERCFGPASESSPSWAYAYSVDLVPLPAAPGSTGRSYDHAQLPRDQWKLYVIEPMVSAPDVPDKSSRLKTVEQASLLTMTPLSLPTVFYAGGTANRTPPGEPPRGPALMVPLTERGMQFDARTADQMRDATARIVNLKPEFFDLKFALEQFRSAWDLRFESRPRLLGLFAALEALLARPGKPGRQRNIAGEIHTKSALLQNRMGPLLGYQLFPSSPGKPRKPSEVWQGLFEIRNLLAHGRTLSFTSQEARHIGSHENAEALLSHALSALMAYAFCDPQLTLDLRDC